MKTSKDRKYMGIRLLRMADMVEKIGVSKGTIYGLMRTQGFPRSFKIGTRATGWLAHEVEAWLERRVEAQQ